MTKDEALSAKHEGATTVALKLALEALENLYNDSELMVTHRQHKGMKNAITAIREALALSVSSTKCEETSHAQPERKPLSDEEIEKIWWETKPYFDKHDFTRAIEAAHGIKE